LGWTTENGARGLGAPRLPDRPTSFLPSYPTAAVAAVAAVFARDPAVLCKVGWFFFRASC